MQDLSNLQISLLLANTTFNMCTISVANKRHGNTLNEYHKVTYLLTLQPLISLELGH